jgi:hypothetical protein
MNANRSTQAAYDYLPAETKVLNINYGEPGWILNGYAYDPNQGGWYEYEVTTKDGCIEVWKRSDFVLWTEIEVDE